VRSFTPLNQRARTQNSVGDFAKSFESGVLNEQNSFSHAGGFPSNGRFRAGNDARCEFIASANSFKYNTSYNSRCRCAAPASAIPHRDGERVTTTSERSASRFGKGEPRGRVGTSTKSRALGPRGHGEFTRSGRERTTTLSN
jgi:hypothetical protein